MIREDGTRVVELVRRGDQRNFGRRNREVGEILDLAFPPAALGGTVCGQVGAGMNDVRDGVAELGANRRDAPLAAMVLACVV